MKEVFEAFENEDKNTLAIFDVDLVLVQPSDPAFQRPNIKRYRSIAKEIMNTISDKTLALALMSSGSKPILVDNCTPHWLKLLQKRGIKAIALTSNVTGPLGSIPSMLNWRIDCLKYLKIDLSKTSPYQKPITFFNLPPYRDRYPEYRNGYLFTNGDSNSKGAVLVDFLQRAHLHPKKIIFIDDREENLTAVQEALTQFDPSIGYTAILYTGAENYPSQEISERDFEQRWKELAEETQRLMN